MHNHTYGEIFEREAPRAARPSRSTARFRPSYNEDLIAPSIGDEGDDGAAHPSTFPCGFISSSSSRSFPASSFVPSPWTHLQRNTPSWPMSPRLLMWCTPMRKRQWCVPSPCTSNGLQRCQSTGLWASTWSTWWKMRQKNQPKSLPSCKSPCTSTSSCTITAG